MNGDERTPESFSIARRWGAGLNLLITLAAVLSLVAMINYLGMRHFARWNWTHDRSAQLSRRTLHVLASLTNNVKVIVYYNSEDPLYIRIRELLREYESAAGGRIQVQYVDRLRQVAAANAVKTTYSLPDGVGDAVIFDGLRRQVVHGSELSDYDTSELMKGTSREVYRTHFKGEMMFTSKIYACSNTRSPKAYFLIGDGEHLPTEAVNGQGYAKFAGVLKNENNFDLQTLDLLYGQKEVPADCDLLVIPGPVLTLDDVAVDAISRYLDGGGRMLVLFNHNGILKRRPTGLEKLLSNWGVEIGQTIILDPENSSNAQGASPIPVRLGAHPIVNSLGSNHVQLILPRALHALHAPASRREEAKVDELLFTGPKTYAVNDLQLTRSRREDAVGSQPLAVAVEKSIPALDRGSTRIVAIGDSILWSNDGIDAAANRDFASATVNWLVQQNVLLNEIPRQRLSNYKLSVTQSQLRVSRVLLLGGMPLAVLAIGFIVWVRRRN